MKAMLASLAFVLVILTSVVNGKVTNKKLISELESVLQDMERSDSEEVEIKKLDRGQYSTRITENDKTLILSMHNNYRAGEGSSNMYKLSWNDSVANKAQQWANTCNGGHGMHDGVGQNIAQNYDYKTAMEKWWEEKAYYDYNRGDYITGCQQGKMCGHYTAMANADTRTIGCGSNQCSFGLFVVCDYYPSGNWQGRKPFLKGPACTKCQLGKFYCNNNLCDSTCHSAGGSCTCNANSVCRNSVVINDCSCKCNAGYNGVDCSEQCRDIDRQCGANPGWPESWCTNPMFGMSAADIQRDCPKMCKKCTATKSSNPKSEKLKQILAWLDE